MCKVKVMKNISFIAATVISLMFLLVKFIEMRFVDKESKPLKLLVRDALFVFFSVIAGNFVIEQLEPMIHDIGAVGGAGGLDNIFTNPVVFTGNPEF